MKRGDNITKRGLMLLVGMFVLVVSLSGVLALDFQKISDTEGDFTGVLDGVPQFGRSVASIGDLNDDGINDIVVGASRDSDGGPFTGAVYVLFMGTDGKVDGFHHPSEHQQQYPLYHHHLHHQYQQQKHQTHHHHLIPR